MQMMVSELDEKTPQPLKAQVKGGRLVLDAPTELPEGTVVELVPADPYAHLDEADELDEQSRQRLHGVLKKSLAQAQAGEGRPAQELIDELRKKHA